MHLAAAPPAPRSPAVAGRYERFPSQRAFCAGRNHAAVVREPGSNAHRQPSFPLM